MKSGNLIIKKNCLQCGSCLGYGYEFLSSTATGEIIVQKNTLLDESSDEFKMLRNICPVDAFEIKKLENVRQQFVTELERLKYYMVKRPNVDKFRFKKEEYSIQIPSASGECRYEYSSESAANSAARSEFDRKMYSQIDTLILKIITEYRVKYLRTYYTKDEDSFFSLCNKEVSDVLNSIVNILKNIEICNDLPVDITKINVYPEEDLVWKMLNKGELMSDEMIFTIRQEFDSNNYSALSSYESYWKIDEKEISDGTDWRGNIKTRDKYCYRNMREAFQELAKDILNSCYYKNAALEERAVELIGGIVDEYNKMLKEKLTPVIGYLEGKLSLLPKENNSKEVKREKYEDFTRVIYYNGEKGFEVNDEIIEKEEVFVTCYEDFQYFYDGKVLKKKSIDNGVVYSEIIEADKNFNYRLIISLGGYFLFTTDDMNLWSYDCHKRELKKLERNVGCLKIYKDVCFYQKFSNHKDRFASVNINCCKMDGSEKKTVAYNAVGMVCIEDITDTTLKYRTLFSPYKTETVTWKDTNKNTKIANVVSETTLSINSYLKK